MQPEDRPTGFGLRVRGLGSGVHKNPLALTSYEPQATSLSLFSLHPTPYTRPPLWRRYAA